MQQSLIPVSNQLLQLLKNVKMLETPVLESFMDEVSLIPARRKTPSLSKQETELMQRINYGVPIAVRERQKILSLKNRYENLTQAEYQELIQLSTQIEESDVVRIQSLITLAQLKNTTVIQFLQEKC